MCELEVFKTLVILSLVALLSTWQKSSISRYITRGGYNRRNDSRRKEPTQGTLRGRLFKRE
jgi:hypothetical protein